MCHYQHLKKKKWSKIENMSVSHMVNAFCLYIYYIYIYIYIYIYTHTHTHTHTHIHIWASLVAQLVKNLPVAQETRFDSCLGKIPWRRDRPPTPVYLGFPGGSDGKESACSVGDLGSIPGLG